MGRLEIKTTLIFLTIPEYVLYILWLKEEEKIMCTLTSLLSGVLNRPVKIFCANFGQIYIFYDVLFGFYHIRCLDILRFGHRFYFWDRKFFGALWPVCYFPAVFWPYLTGNFISRLIAHRSARAWFQMFEWGLQRIYNKSYFI